MSADRFWFLAAEIFRVIGIVGALGCFLALLLVAANDFGRSNERPAPTAQVPPFKLVPRPPFDQDAPANREDRHAR